MAADFRVIAYINGVLFSPRSVSYSASQGDMATFSIDVPAVPHWDILPARSHAAVFFTDPVTKTWRFLCEGEYDKTSSGKVSTGQRSRTLGFRSLHSYWNQADYTSILSISSAPDSGTELGKQFITARAAGQNVIFPDSIQNDTAKLNDLEQMIQAVAKDNSQSISAFFPALVERVTLQTPVEAFYAFNRKIIDKMFVDPDKDIAGVVDYQRFIDTIQHGFHNFGLRPNTKLSEIICKYEDLVFYQHTPIAGPCFIGKKIPELMFIPHLYSVLPPVCNIIFADQITNIQGANNFCVMPTRIIAQMQIPFADGSDPFPMVYMANDLQKLTNITAKTAEVAASHDLLSEDELLRGVVPSCVQCGFEKLLDPIKNNETGSQGATRLEPYIEEATKHQFQVEKARATSKSVNCAFMPYLVPGFPCLVEDSTGPFHGIILAINHELAPGAPFTSVSVGFVRPAFVVNGLNRTPPIPHWINSIFRPQKVNATYARIFGIKDNAVRVGTSTLGPFSVLDSVMHGSDAALNALNDASVQVDMDKLASTVIPLLTFDEDMNEIEFKDLTRAAAASGGGGTNTVADRLRATMDPAQAMRTYQYREGISLKEYMQYHNIPLAEDINDAANVMPPDDVAPALYGHPLFGHPSGLEFVGLPPTGPFTLDQLAELNSSIYGVYKLTTGSDGSISIRNFRQKCARTIAAAIGRGISPT